MTQNVGGFNKEILGWVSHLLANPGKNDWWAREMQAKGYPSLPPEDLETIVCGIEICALKKKAKQS